MDSIHVELSADTPPSSGGTATVRAGSVCTGAARGGATGAGVRWMDGWRRTGAAVHDLPRVGESALVADPSEPRFGVSCDPGSRLQVPNSKTQVTELHIPWSKFKVPDSNSRLQVHASLSRGLQVRFLPA